MFHMQLNDYPWVTINNYVHHNVIISKTPDIGEYGMAADFNAAGMHRLHDFEDFETRIIFSLR